jgi:hypothetical protein
MKDDEAFLSYAKTLDGATVIKKEDETYGTLYGFTFENGVKTPFWANHLEKDMRTRHIADGWALIIQEIGHEKMRYLTGVCTVISSSEYWFNTIEMSHWGKCQAESQGLLHTPCEY